MERKRWERREHKKLHVHSPTHLAHIIFLFVLPPASRQVMGPSSSTAFTFKAPEMGQLLSATLRSTLDLSLDRLEVSSHTFTSKQKRRERREMRRDEGSSQGKQNSS